MSHVSASPPLIPDGRISRVRLAATAVPEESSPEARGLSPRRHAPRASGLYLPLDPVGGIAGTPALGPAHVPFGIRHVPRAALRERGATSLTAMSGTASAGITRPSLLLPAHAPDQLPPDGFGFPNRSVLAGCCEPPPQAGPSRRYLHNLSTVAWTLTPPRLVGAPVRCFPTSTGPTLYSRGVARGINPATPLLAGANSRGCSHSFMFRPLSLLDLLMAPTEEALGPPRQRGRLPHAMNVWLPTRTVISLRARIRTIGAAGLSPARLWPCRPLPEYRCAEYDYDLVEA